MPNLQKHNTNLPAVVNLGLIEYLFPQEENEYNAVELVISLNSSAINIKELSSYLDFIYVIDGYLSEIGHAKYIHYPKVQIEIDEIRVGSWEIVIHKFLLSGEANKLGIIFLALKFLPKIIQTAVEATHKFYEMLDKREDFLEKKEKRKNRKKIRDLINIEVSELDKKNKEKIVDILEDLYEKRKKKLNPASRLAQKTVKDLKIKPVNKKN